MGKKTETSAVVEKHVQSLSTPLKVLDVKEVSISGSSASAVILFVPFKQLKAYKAIHTKLTTELEKKLSNKHVVIIGQRTILGPNHTRNPGVKAGTPRPNSRTLTSVQEAMLDDLVYPVDIVGKRTKYKVDGSKIMNIFLNPKDQITVEPKLDAFAAVYRSLTNKKAAFAFPVEA